MTRPVELTRVGIGADYRMTLDRACEQLDAFNHAVTEWGEISAHIVPVERDRDVFEKWGPPRVGRVIPSNAIGVELIFREHYPIKRNWSLILNEAVHGFRSCLDQLAFALAWVNTKGPLTREVVEGSEFPIYGKTALPPGRKAQKIGAINPKAQAIIEGLQPHHDPDYRLNKLWALHELDRIGKHRLLPVVGQSITENFLQLPLGGPPIEINRMGVIGGSVKNGAPIGWYVLVPPSDGKMKVRFVAEVEAMLGVGLPSFGTAVETLEAIRDEITGPRIFGQLEGFLRL